MHVVKIKFKHLIDAWLVRHLSPSVILWAFLKMFHLSNKNMFSALLNKEGRKEMFYLTTHSTHFIYGYMASHIW